jgi:PilZ domain
MVTPGRAPLRAIVGRRVTRCPLAVPVRITVLRPGNAYSIPGRSLDLGEGGIAAVLAGELHAGDPVGVEFLLPDLGLGLQAKAVVRHHGPLRCGFEFQQLTRHQQALLREWTRLMLGRQPQEDLPPEKGSEARERRDTATDSRLREPSQRFRRLLWWVAGILLLAGLAAWWNWERQWKDLEQQVPPPAKEVGMKALPQNGTPVRAIRDMAVNFPAWEKRDFSGRRAG